MAKAASTKAAPAPSRTAGREDAVGKALFPLKVVYYRRMCGRRVFPVTITWQNKEKRRPPAGAKPVVLRLLMAGAQVLPAEQPFDPANADAKATFYVTPLAKGWLRTERLEVVVDGRKVQEMPLPARVTSQRTSCVLLGLAFLVPWFLLTFCQFDRLRDEKKTGKPKTPGEVLERHIAENVPPLPAVVKDNVPAVRENLVEARHYVGQIYDLLIVQTSSNQLPFYSAVGFLILAFVSWLTHRDKRRKKIGKPIPLLAVEAPAASTPLEEEDFT